MKTINLYAVSRANIDPGTPGFILSPVDPDPGIAANRRTVGSGFALPVPTVVPDGAEVAETKHGEPFLWLGDQALNLEWHPRKGVVTAWPAEWGTKHPRMRDCWIFSAVTLDSLTKILPLT